MQKPTMLVLLAVTLSNASAVLADPGAIDVRTDPLFLNPNSPHETKVGEFIYRGGIEIRSRDKDFGGLSGLVVRDDGARLLAVSDAAHWFTADINYANGNITSIDNALLAPIRNKKGKKLSGKGGDAESIAVLAEGWPSDKFLPDRVAVGFERKHRIWRYDLDEDGLSAHAASIDLHDGVDDLPNNQGLEALSLLAPMRLIMFSEGGYDGDRLRGWITQINPHGQKSNALHTALFLKAQRPYQPTDLVRTNDNAIWLLERRFSPAAGPGMQIRKINAHDLDNGTIEGEVVLELPGIYSIDNMEGLAARDTDDGRTFFYILSDDNFNPLQRTILLMFELKRD